MKDSPKTSKSDNEALYVVDYIEAELEKTRNTIPEEADAAEDEADGMSHVALQEARDAFCKAKKQQGMVKSRRRPVKSYPGLVKDCDRIGASSQLLDVDKDYFPSFPDGKIDPSEKVMSQYEALSVDAMKDSPRTSKSDNEALATDDYIEAELEKIRNMTPEEADAAQVEAYRKCCVAVWEVRDAICKAEKAVGQLSIEESCENFSRTELEKMHSHQTAEEATAKCDAAKIGQYMLQIEATAKCDAANRAVYAAVCTVVQSKRLIKAISKARENVS